jgi:hypothetical protein
MLSENKILSDRIMLSTNNNLSVYIMLLFDAMLLDYIMLSADTMLANYTVFGRYHYEKPSVKNLMTLSLYFTHRSLFLTMFFDTVG